MFLQSLESRRLFAASLVGTELRVYGTAGNDIIKVRQLNPATIEVSDNGVLLFFPDAAVNTLRLNATNPANLNTGTAGNDLVEITSTAALPLNEQALLLGGQGQDFLTGGDGNDSLRGDSESDRLDGGIGNDTLNGGTGDNQMRGGANNDTMLAGGGRDTYDGGSGTDLADYSDRVVALNISIDGVANDGTAAEFDNVFVSTENVLSGTGNDTLTGSAGPNALGGNSGDDRVNGGADNDTIRGGSGADTLVGAAGADSIRGEDGNDVVFGGSGADSIFGGNGNDNLIGGVGADKIFGEAGNDQISSADGAIDATVDGGAGFDIIDIDGGDPVVNGELVF